MTIIFLINISKFEYIENFFYIVSKCCEVSQIWHRILSKNKMNHKALAPIVAVGFVGLILFVGANIGPVVPDHQTLAFSGHGGAYGFYGPCIIRHFSYTWCLNGFSTEPPGLVPSHFTMGVFSGCNGQTTSFPDSENGTAVSLGPKSCVYSITERGPFIHDYRNTVSGDCGGYLNPGDKKTCLVTNTFVPGDHT